jgi:glycosyltransferase involved in cell wall biosynthesis
MNVLLVSTGDFSGDTATDLCALAGALSRLGVDAVHGGVDSSFPDGRGPDLIHAWSTAGHVRALTADLAARYRCPYLVHLERHEESGTARFAGALAHAEFAALPVRLLDEILPPSAPHPRRSFDFLAQAIAVTASTDRLLETKPPHLPGLVVWPGFETPEPRDRPRRKLAKPPNALVLLSVGILDPSSESAISSLVLAAGILHRKGLPVLLMRIGENRAALDIADAAIEAGYLRNLGPLPSGEILSLLASATIVVQPGRPGPFDGFHFPARVPALLASGKPVILGPSNLTRFLTDGVDCLLLQRGDPLEIAEKIDLLRTRPELARSIGAAGSKFAAARLSWPANLEPLAAFYRGLLTSRACSPAPAPASADDDPPVKLIALTGQQGLYGCCIDHGSLGRVTKPFCVRWTPESGPISGVIPAFQHPLYIKVRGAPLLLVDRATEIPRRDLPPVHIVMQQTPDALDPRPGGFDAALELPAHPENYLAFAAARVAEPLPLFPRYRCVTFPPDASPELYRLWLTALVQQAMELRPLQEPLIFISAPNSPQEFTPECLDATFRALSAGVANYLRNSGIPIADRAVERALAPPTSRTPR